MKEKTTEKVYHYCSVETFLNIIRNRTIRLSDVNKSNDYLELKAMCSLVIDEIKSLVKSDPEFSGYNGIIGGLNDSDALISIATFLLERMLNYNDLLCYAVCFSEESDLLSQWCRYADDGRGVAIGFDVELFEEICSEFEYFKFEKVTYVGNNKQNSDVTQIATDFVGNLLTYIVNDRTGELFIKTGVVGFGEKLLIEMLFRDCFFIKTEQFSEEKEWRLALTDELRKSDDWDEIYNWKDGYSKRGIFQLIPNGVEFRATSDNIISFMDLNYSKFCGESLIKEIIIGPKSKIEEEDIYQMLKHYFAYDCDIDHILVHKSKVSLQ